MTPILDTGCDSNEPVSKTAVRTTLLGTAWGWAVAGGAGDVGASRRSLRRRRRGLGSNMT